MAPAQTSIADGLHRSKEEQDLLNLIDSLRTRQLGQLISIPQVIIVGDQSSGKSSTLEAGTGIPFPTADGLCTVFATELRLRRQKETNITISIVPASHRSEAEKKKIEEFGGEQDNFTREDISEWIDKAKTVMGISESLPISDDVLKIDVSGPEYPLLTIVDLPGLVHAGKGKEPIRSMLNAYMAEPRSVILAVVSGKSDIETQKVLDLVKTFDPEGRRTFGIITKPDIPNAGSKSEKDLVALAKNQHPEFSFRLGWHVLRNRKEQEAGSSDAERDAVEREFLSRALWRDIPKQSAGRGTLKPRLSQVLMDQIRAEFPALVAEVEKNLDDRKAMLEKLGDSRATLDEQRAFLVKLSNKFQLMVHNAIGGAYSHTFFGNVKKDNGYKRRFRAVIQNLNKEFSETMGVYGHKRIILDDEVVVLDSEKEITRTDIVQEVVRSLKRSRGCELPGMFNPVLVRDLFVDQASPWRTLAERHLQDCVDAAKHFLNSVVSFLTSFEGPQSAAQSQMGETITREILNPFLERTSKEMTARLEDLLRTYYEMHPITYNHYFTENIQNARKKQLQERMKKEMMKFAGLNNVSSLAQSRTMTPLNFINSISAENEADMDGFACSEIVDYMEAYYKVALKEIVDNVAIQIVEELLVESIPSLLSTSSVQNMSPDLIWKIAAESSADQYRRAELKRELKILDDCLKTCKAFASRTPAKSTLDPQHAPADEMEDLETLSQTSGSFGMLTDSDETTIEV